MSKKILLFICLIMCFSFVQKKSKTYYIVNKGLYVQWQEKSKRIKVPFKENHDFYFSVRNDSVVLIQELYKGRPMKAKEYRISSQYDTTYIKHYVFVNGKRKLDEIEKVIFQKVY